MKKNDIVWSWRDAAFGLAITFVPAVIIALGNVDTGLRLLIGALPAAVIGLLPTRRSRRRLVVIGLLFGVFLMLGSFLAQWAAVAVIGIFALSWGAAELAAKKPLGVVAMQLCVPLAGIGMSYAGLENSVGLGLLIILGSLIAFLWSLLFPEYKAPAQPKGSLMTHAQARDYGIRLGLAAATAVGISFFFGLEHIGWVAGATLFVMRPMKDMQELRSIGRIVSVFVGALAASWLLTLTLPSLAIALLAAGALVVASATHKSYWYITPAFTTFLVFWVLLYGDTVTSDVTFRFNERVLETLGGVVIAGFFGILVPKIMT